tara:strand:- start:144 stop:395 length:252 start_codon:yes stop_codon:yes gene_type:complete
MQNKFEEVGKKVKEINDYYKEYQYSSDSEKVVEKMVEDVISFARKHDVPLKISAASIIENVKNEMAGEELEEESSEYYEDSDC